MTALRPLPGELEPIERASVDELRALQLERMQWSVRHAYDNVAHYRRAFDAKGVHPGDLKELADLAKFPFTVKTDLRDNYPFGMFAVPRERVARIHASSGTTGKPTVVGYTLHDIDTWADLVARSIRAAGGRPGDMVHVAYGYGLFTGGLGAHYGAERAGCTVIPMSGGQTEKQVQLIQDLKPNIIMVTPSYMQVLIEELTRQGIDPTLDQPRGRHLRRRAVDRGDAEGNREPRRHRRGRHLRPLRGDGPGRGERVRRDQGRPGRLGRPLLSRDHRSRERRGAGRRRGRRARLHDADQGGAAGDPLSHARPDAPPAADRARDAPHGQDRRPQRRHADHPRRQPVPDPDRGDRPRPRPALRAIPAGRHARGQPRRGRGALRGAAGARRRRPRRARGRGCASASRP